MASPSGYRLEGQSAVRGNFEQWDPRYRVMVSNSVLQAYSEMRGNHDKKYLQFGPLYEGLFRAERGDPGGDQLEIPALKSQDR